MSVFINRERELKALEKRLKSQKAEFLILYGRRRVGKSTLIDEFISKHKGIKLCAREESKKLQLRKFKDELAEFFNDEILKKMEFNDWDAFLEYINKKAKRRIIIAIDEFPYLVKEDKSLPSVLQEYWDKKLKYTKIFLILCGSSISMMESLMGHRSPLYGRRTAQLLLTSFSFLDIIKYLKDISKGIEFYSVFGGTPAYILEADPKKDILQNIIEKILSVDSFLYKDAEFILRQEISEPRYYFSILLSLAKGNNKIGLICNDTGLSKSIVNKYLSVLIDLKLVKRIVPVTEDYKSKKGRYYLSDNFFDFWFRFIYPFTDKIESGNLKPVVEYIRGNLSKYIGKHFEDVVIEILSKKRVFNFTKIGKWWHRNKEIDVLALDEDKSKIFLGECKWRNNVNAKKICAKLDEISKHIKWRNKNRKEVFMIFAKSFKKKIDVFNSKKVLCFDLKDLKNIINFSK